MAHKKGVGSTDNGRDSKSKRLGVKLFGGQTAKAGNIIVRQRGTKYHPGENVYMGKDFTLHAQVAGTVVFRRKKSDRLYVNIVPDGEVATAPAPAKAKAQPEAKPAAPAVEPTTVAAVAEAAEITAPTEAKEEMIAAAAAPTPAAGEKIVLPSGKKVNFDDLKIVEGIGPKIEGLLHAAGIKTWKALAEAPEADVQKVLDEAGPRYRMHKPATWAKQAALAVAGKWAELEELQDILDGGVEPGKAADASSEEE